MINKNLILEFIEKKYINEDKFNLVPSNKVHKLFCTIYNLTEKDINIRIFIPFLKKILEEKGWNVKSKKIRLKEQGSLPRNCLVGISINMDLGPKKEQEKEQLVPTMNKVSTTPTTKEAKNNKVKVQKKERTKDVNLIPFIEKFYMRGTKENVLGSNEVHNLALDFYRDNPKMLEIIKDKPYFTKKFKENWVLKYPDTPLLTGDSIRDPNDSNKRGIACIKRKGS